MRLIVRLLLAANKVVLLIVVLIAKLKLTRVVPAVHGHHVSRWRSHRKVHCHV